MNICNFYKEKHALGHLGRKQVDIHKKNSEEYFAPQF